VNEQPDTSGWQPAPTETEQAAAGPAETEQAAAGPAETEQAVTETPFAAEPLPETPTAQESVVDFGAGEAASGGERPEVAVAAAFAGGLLLARTLKRFAD